MSSKSVTSVIMGLVIHEMILYADNNRADYSVSFGLKNGQTFKGLYLYDFKTYSDKCCVAIICEFENSHTLFRTDEMAWFKVDKEVSNKAAGHYDENGVDVTDEVAQENVR